MAVLGTQGMVKASRVMAVICMVWTLNATATTYYVDAQGGNDNNDGRSLAAPWRTIGKANSLVQPGDTVCLRAGTYSETIRPSASGTPGNYITYCNYDDEEVVITNVSDGVDLRDRHYINIDGLKIMNVGGYWINMRAPSDSSTYNIIQNCHMEEALGWGGIWLEGEAHYNRILNNTVIGYATPDDVIYLRDGASYNLFEGNDLRYGAHATVNIQIGCHRNVIRNNRVWNPWHTGVNAYRSSDRTLIEGNIVLDCGEDSANMPPWPNLEDGQEDERQISRDKPRRYHVGIMLGSSDCIVRNNVVVNTGTMSIDTYASYGSWSLDNRIYSNTVTENHDGLYSESSEPVYGNIIKNNIYFDNTEYEIRQTIDSSQGVNSFVNNNIVHSNGGSGISLNYDPMWEGNQAYDPQFANVGGVNDYDNSNFDPQSLQLRSQSPMIDAGAFLTATITGGNGTSILVEDASYFYDGWGIPGEQGDLIQLEGQTETARITSIDYDNNRITVDRALSWNAQQGVSLAYHGSAPDIGAFEYAYTGTTTYTLSTSATHGSVTPSQGSYESGTSVALQATAESGYEFTGWSGDLSGSTNPASLTMNSDKSVTANFAAVAPTTYTLSTSATHGSVTPSQGSYESGTSVTLTATPVTGYSFAGWSGDASGTSPSTTVTMDSNKSVTANFTVNTYTLSTSATHGSVTPSQGSYESGTSVTLTATPVTGYSFAGWSGDASGTSPSTTVTMDSNKSVTANFTAENADETPPVVVASSPEAEAVQVPLNSLVTLHVVDDGEGVDADTVMISMNDTTVYSGNVSSYDSAGGACRRTGTEADYTYAYQSNAEFDFSETITVRVNAADRNGNVMDEYVYSFETEMWSFGANRSVSWELTDMDAGAPVTVCDSSDNIWVAWHAGAAGQQDIYVAQRSLEDGDFASPVQVTTDAAYQGDPDLAIGADDRLYLVWQDSRRGNWDVYFSTSTDGVNWSVATLITDSDADQTAPVIAVDGAAGCHVAWEDNREGHRDIYVASSSDGFASATIGPVTLDVSDQTQPDIAADASGNVYVVWTDARNGSDDIYGAMSYGDSWTEVAMITGAGNQYSPALATEYEGAWLHLVWADDSAGNSDVYYTSTEGMPSSPLGGIRLIDDTLGADQLAPTIATVGSTGNGLKVFVCWQDWRNVTAAGEDTDLYFVEVKNGDETNVLVGDDGTGAEQGAPSLGVNSDGFPCVVWTDERNGDAEIYYAGTTSWDAEVLDSRTVTASEGGTVGETSPSDVGHVSVVIPPAASSQDATVTIAKVENPPAVPATGALSYEFGPSGLRFNHPVMITIPYNTAEFGDWPPTPWWYDSQTGGLSQEGITGIEIITLTPTVSALRFNTTHFTPYYVISAAAEEEIGAGSGGGGCSLAYGQDASDPVGFFIPYVLITGAVVGLRFRDARRRASP